MIDNSTKTSLAREVHARIAPYDRRSPSVLSETEAQYSTRRQYVDALISLTDSNEASVSSGATWMMKSLLERGQTLSTRQCGALIGKLNGVCEWDAQLHVCQSIRFIEIGNDHVDGLVEWLQPLLSHRRPFLRAWSLDALCHVARHHSAFQELANEQLERAFKDNAASVRARARNISVN